MNARTFTGNASMTRPIAASRDESADESFVLRIARWFYVGMALACIVTVFSGFAASFYLRPRTSMPELAPLVVAHGIVLTSWFVLFLAQTALVSARRIRLHRWLGLAAFGLAVLIVVSSPVIAIGAARRGVLPGDPLAFLHVILWDILAFAVFVAAGMYYRRRSEPHKRLMLLATVSLLPPAISRWPIAVKQPAVIPMVLLVFVAAMLVHDRLARRRLHAVSLWGGLALLASGPVRLALSQTEAWHHIARWLVR